MRLLQRYILGELLRVFAFVLGVLTVLLVFVGVFKEMQDKGLRTNEALEILPFVVPALLPYTIPATMLLTVCVVYGRLSANQEITAARAAGINVLSLMTPAFVLAAVLSVGSLLLTDQVIPWSVSRIQRIVTSAMEDIFLENLRNELLFETPDQRVSISVEEVQGRTLIHPNFQYRPNPERRIIVTADSAEIAFDIEKNEAEMVFVHANINMPGERTVYIDREVQRFPLPRLFDAQKPRHKTMKTIKHEMATLDADKDSLEEDRFIDTAMILATGEFHRFAEPSFRAFQNSLDVKHADFFKLKTELHNRFSMACSCFFFVLLGSPYSILKARGQFLTNFAFCFTPILFLYYPVAFLMMNFGKTGTFDPAWGVWFANGLLLGRAIFILRQTLRH